MRTLVMLTGILLPLGSLPVLLAQSNPPINVSTYGAACNYNGTSGHDDTAAFQSAANAAATIYRSTSNPVEIDFSGNCQIDGTITSGSGVHWRGSGEISVPSQVGSVFLAENATDVAWDNVKINVVSNSGNDSPDVAGIEYLSTSADASAHSNVAVRNCTISNSPWGIVVFYTAGTGSLSDVQILGNTVLSPTGYSIGTGSMLRVR